MRMLYIILCKLKFHLNSPWMILDVDECSGTNSCDSRAGVGYCTNTIGSYTCSCAEGYTMNYNSQCLGE